MRKVLALALVFAVQAAALSAPLVHAHPGEHSADHHDASTKVHGHWTGHGQARLPANATALGDDDEGRAVFVNAFVAVTASMVVLASVPPIFELSVPSERPARRVVEIAGGHDPPAVRARPSRAPPFDLL